MSRNFEDVIYNLIIDRIQNGARNSDLRQAYDDYMANRKYNNPEMNELFEHVLKMIEMEWDRCRSERDEQELVSVSIDEGIAQHIGLWVTSDRDLANAIQDDNVYRDLQTAAGEWERLEKSYDRFSRNARDDRGGRGDYRDDRRGNGYRDNGRRSNGFGSNLPRGSSGRDDRDDRGSARMTGGFGNSRQSRQEEDRRDRREQETRRIERDVRPRTDARTASPLARGGRADSRQEEVVETTRHDPRDEVIDQNTGPNFDSERPFDSFWDKGELWQLAHVSTLQWTWSQKQQFRRTYNPDQEVCFLVQSADGSVREEFLPMTDDLQPFAHEIRAITRPHQERRVRDRAGNDQEISLPGDDIDAVDLDKLNKDVEAARRIYIGDLDVNKAHVVPGPLVVGSVQDGLLGATRQRLKLDCDVAVINSMVTQVVPTTGKGLDALSNFKALLTNNAEGGLDVLHKRLAGIKDKVDESVMELIDRHYTDEVNHLLKHAFEFGALRIDSFLGDFPDLVEVIGKQRSPSYAQHMLSRTRNIALSLVIDTDEEIRRDVIAAQDVLPEHEDDNDAYRTFRENAVVAFRPKATLSVNVDADAFGVLTSDTRVPPKQGPNADVEMADTLVALYALGRRATASGRVFLLTADNIELELVAEAGARDIVGIRRI